MLRYVCLYLVLRTHRFSKEHIWLKWKHIFKHAFFPLFFSFCQLEVSANNARILQSKIRRVEVAGICAWVQFDADLGELKIAPKQFWRPLQLKVSPWGRARERADAVTLRAGIAAPECGRPPCEFYFLRLLLSVFVPGYNDSNVSTTAK